MDLVGRVRAELLDFRNFDLWDNDFWTMKKRYDKLVEIIGGDLGLSEVLSAVIKKDDPAYQLLGIRSKITTDRADEILEKWKLIGLQESLGSIEWEEWGLLAATKEDLGATVLMEGISIVESDGMPRPKSPEARQLLEYLFGIFNL